MGNFLSRWGLVSFIGRTPHHGVGVCKRSSLSSARLIQSTLLCLISFRSILILYLHLRLGLRSVSFLPVFFSELCLHFRRHIMVISNMANERCDRQTTSRADKYCAVEVLRSVPVSLDSSPTKDYRNIMQGVRPTITCCTKPVLANWLPKLQTRFLSYNTRKGCVMYKI